MAEEVLTHASVSDKVALKKNKKLKALLSKLLHLRTALWDYVRAEWASYVNLAITSVVRLVSEAIVNDGEAVYGAATELVNTEELRTLLEMRDLYKHALVSDRILLYNPSKVTFCADIGKYFLFSKTLVDIMIIVFSGLSDQFYYSYTIPCKFAR